MDFDAELTDCTFTNFLQRDRWRVMFSRPGGPISLWNGMLKKVTK